MMVTILLFLLGFTFCFGDIEPACSKFDYEEKILAKTIRLEYTVDDLAKRLTKVEGALEETATNNKDLELKLGTIEDNFEHQNTIIQKLETKVNATQTNTGTCILMNRNFAVKITTAPGSIRHTFSLEISESYLFNSLSQLMRLWYLLHRGPAKAQASLRIRAVSPEPSLFANMNYGSRPKNQTSSPTGWLRMRDWRMSLRRTKSTIISWDGSFILIYRTIQIPTQSFS